MGQFVTIFRTSREDLHLASSIVGGQIGDLLAEHLDAVAQVVPPLALQDVVVRPLGAVDRVLLLLLDASPVEFVELVTDAAQVSRDVTRIGRAFPLVGNSCRKRFEATLIVADGRQNGTDRLDGRALVFRGSICKGR